jgi:ketosteroid isomerase-like protein
MISSFLEDFGPFVGSRVTLRPVACCQSDGHCRHPGLDPGPMNAVGEKWMRQCSWMPDQVRHDDWEGLVMLALTLGLAAASLQAEMQALEAGRNAAIRAGDAAALERLYARDFQGIAASGARVDRAALLAILARNAGGDVVAESEVLSAREAGGLVLVEGRLRLMSGDRARLLSESLYLHVFRRAGGRWQMVAGAATPAAQAAR